MHTPCPPPRRVPPSCRALRLRGPEPHDRVALAGVGERDLDRLPDPQGVDVAVDDVGHHPRALVELDEGDDVRRHIAPWALAAAADGEAVDRATTGRLGPLRVEAVTVRTDRAGVPDDVATSPAAREQQPAFAGGGPELRGLRR